MVNVDDYKNDISYKVYNNRLSLIFARQMELMKKYHPIEEKNGLLITKDIPVDLNDAKGQARLKDFAWRITEELGEALSAFELHPKIENHFNEEIVDALHFLVEFTILAGMNSEELINFKLDNEYNIRNYVLTFVNPLCKEDIEFLLEYAVYIMNSDNYGNREYNDLVFYTGRIIQRLSETCNTLKNKPWKQTQMLTDIGRFKSGLQNVWVSFFQLCICAKIFSDQLFRLYFSKSEVNKFRIRSQY